MTVWIGGFTDSDQMTKSGNTRQNIALSIDDFANIDQLTNTCATLANHADENGTA